MWIKEASPNFERTVYNPPLWHKLLTNQILIEFFRRAKCKIFFCIFVKWGDISKFPANNWCLSILRMFLRVDVMKKEKFRAGAILKISSPIFHLQSVKWFRGSSKTKVLKVVFARKSISTYVHHWVGIYVSRCLYIFLAI